MLLFPHVFYIQIPRCIENIFIEWCLVLIIKWFDSQRALESTDTITVVPVDCLPWRISVRVVDQMTSWRWGDHTRILIGRFWGWGLGLAAHCFCVQLYYSNRIWALHLLCQPVPCIEKDTASCHAGICHFVSINEEYARTILCIWVLIFIV